MFPYIKEIKVNDCFAHQDFNILNKESEPIKHFILTGKNGSGKTTILNRINKIIVSCVSQINFLVVIDNLKRKIINNPNSSNVKLWEMELKEYEGVELKFGTENDHILSLSKNMSYFHHNKNNFIYSYFKAHRKVNLTDVKTVTKEDDLRKILENGTNQQDLFIQNFKQYLVNKKVYEAFDYMNGKHGSIKKSNKFFDDFTSLLKTIFKDHELEFIFEQESFEFYLIFKNGQKVTFNQLSEGFSAFLSILMDLLLRVDLIRKQTNDYRIDPPGFVLIDEPETHFHIEMQYEILPLLTKIFPNIQFVIATHSPAVISSLEESIVFDISSKRYVNNTVLGSSYSELMVSHFGLENEFGPKADELFIELDIAYKDKNLDAINKLVNKYEKILTPSLRIELESRIIELKSKNNLL
jgi:predicted ATP-binding protein involved in virulence